MTVSHLEPKVELIYQISIYLTCSETTVQLFRKCSLKLLYQRIYHRWRASIVCINNLTENLSNLENN